MKPSQINGSLTSKVRKEKQRRYRQTA